MHLALITLFAVLCHMTTSQHESGSNTSVPIPQMYYLHVNSDIKYRYASTLVTCKIANPARIPQEVSFSAVLPETAFISGFTIEVDGKEYNAYVKEKEEARQEYTEAVRHGQTAAHVALSARDSNRFTVSVNLEPQKKVVFKLKYEELLSRRLGTYKHVINLDPGHIVQDLSVKVNIDESTDIATIKVPALRITNEISEDPDAGSTNPLATIEHPTSKSAVVKFAPTPEQQMDLAIDGIKGQLIVEYDVDRTAHPGEVLVRDGYFVHFFAPADLPPLRKHVTFVLDVSGSMMGRKVEQLRQAMTTILGDLNRNDLFSIVPFSDTAQVWDPALNSSEIDKRIYKLTHHYAWGYPLHEHQDVQEENDVLPPTVIAEATLDNVNKAKDFVGRLEALSSTNMYDALMKAIKIMNLGHEVAQQFSETNEIHHQIQPEPIIIFLTDGQPNRNKDMITTEVTKANTGKYSLFSLALGNDADLGFLKKLSLRNSGFARKIYEASDTALQLRDFYREVASPLLANITFKYQTEEGEPEKVTKSNFRRLFFGSELVVAGKLQANNFTVKVEGRSSGGQTTYPFVPICPHIFPGHEVANHTPSSMERMWAYLTIQQLLEEDEAKDHSHDDRNLTFSEKERALQLALRYSFVTPLTSLVVVKPNETRSVGTRDASIPEEGHPGNWMPPIPQPLVGGPQMAPGSSSFYAPPRGNAFIARPAAMSHGSAGRYPLPPVPYDTGMLPDSVQFEDMPIQGMPPPPPPPPPYVPVMAGSSASGTIWVPQGPPQLPLGAPITLIPLTLISWLPNEANNNTIALNIYNQVIHLQIAEDDQPNVPTHTCMSPAGLGECRHLRYCALDVFASNKTEFEDNYYCQIHNYVGVCCPLHLGQASSMSGLLAPPNNQSSLALVPISNITWFNSQTTNNTMTLSNPITVQNEQLQVASENEPNTTYGTCISPAGLGFCRHFRHCTLKVFANQVTDFYPNYFCKISGSYVGVCCPLNVMW